MTALMTAPTATTVNDDRTEVIPIPSLSGAPTRGYEADHLKPAGTGAPAANNFAILTAEENAALAMDDDWRIFAVCADDEDPDRWVDLPPVRIHGRNNPSYDAHVADLAAVCNTCPVMDTCLGKSLAMNVRGVFAGHDEFDRADMREVLGLPTPPMMPPPETEDDARLMDQQFTALRLARHDLTNKQIAAELGVSTMTVSRLLASDDKPAKRRTRKPATDDQMPGRINRAATA